MLKSNFGQTEVNIRQITISWNRQLLEDVLLEFIGRRPARGIATEIIHLTADTSFIIAKVENNFYQLMLDDDRYPVFEKYNITESIKNILSQNDFPIAYAEECTENILEIANKTELISSENAEKEPAESKKSLWIPKGFKYYTGDLETGYVVIDKNGNEFTYLPAIDKYVSRYEISKSADGKTPMSVSGKPAWTDITQADALQVALSFAPECDSDLIESFEEWSTICEFISTKIDYRLVYEDSSPIGCYYPNSETPTGTNCAFMTYNLDSLAGNHWCLTKNIIPLDDYHSKISVVGGCFEDRGDINPMYSHGRVINNVHSKNMGFRIVLKK